MGMVSLRNTRLGIPHWMSTCLLLLYISLGCEQFVYCVSNENAEECRASEGESFSRPDPYLVICTRMRNEAPYIREWIEYHRLLGFDQALLLNDMSDDDTQCFMDVYSNDSFQFVTQISRTVKPRDVFDECAKIIRESDEFNEANTWMITHDLDEFLWYNETKFSSLQDAVRSLSLERDGVVRSLQVPRLVFGSSHKDHYEPKAMIERFTKRFDPRGCPEDFEVPYCDTYAYCYDYTENEIDNAKSMSLISSLASDCFLLKKKGGESPPTEVPSNCLNTHYHEVASSSLETRPPRQQVDARMSKRKEYYKKEELLESMAVSHYMSKSREEFYQRICSSRFFEKYYEPDGCNPAKNFDTMQASANGFKDLRWHAYAEQLRVRLLETSSDFEHCSGEPSLRRPWHEYDKCWDTHLSMLEEDD